MPKNNDVKYIITARELVEDFYLINDEPYEVDLFKDYFISPNLLSTIKSNNKFHSTVGPC